MKNLMGLILFVGLVGCGKGGGGSGDVTDPINPPPQCKGIFSKWKSATTSEEHDFRGMVYNMATNYHFPSTNGYMCGSSNNLMTATINEYQPHDVEYQDGFTGYVQFNYHGSNDCPNDYDSGGVLRQATWKIECDTLYMCNQNGNSTYSCREFN